MRRWLVGALFCAAGTGLWTQVAFADGCTITNASLTFPKALASIKDWEASRGITIDSSALADVQLDFCSQALIVSEQQGTPISQIDQDSVSIISQYLDGQRSTTTSLSLHDVMQNVYSLDAAPGLPEPPHYRVVQVVLTRAIDSLVVNGDVLNPASAIMVAVGHATIVGRLGSAVVCQTNFVVAPVGNLRFQC